LRFILFAALFIMLSSLTSFLIFAKNFRPDILSDPALRKAYPSGRQMAKSAESREKSTVFIFTNQDGAKISVNVSPIDKNKPCFERTRRFNVSFKGATDLTPQDEINLKRFVAVLKDAENRHKHLFTAVNLRLWWADINKTLNSTNNIPLVIFLLFVLLIYDVIFSTKTAGADSGQNPQSARVTTQPAGARSSVIFRYLTGALALIVIAFSFFEIIKSFNWHIYFPDDFNFFNGVDRSYSVVDYILSDKGLPNISYRALLYLLAETQSVTLIRMLSFVTAGAVLAALFLIASRHSHPLIACGVVLFFMRTDIFRYSVIDLRGYPLFVLISILCIFTFEAALLKPSFTRFFILLISGLLSFTSNPLSASLIGGAIIYYFVFHRKTIGGRRRYIADLHIAYLILCILLCHPFITNAVALHTGPIKVMAGEIAPYTTFMKAAFFSSFVFAAAVPVFSKSAKCLYFTSAAAGIWATFTLYQLNILARTDKYLSLVIPISIIGITIMADYSIKKSGAGKHAAIRYAGTAALIILILAKAYGLHAWSAAYNAQRLKFTDSANSIDSLIVRNKPDAGPVIIYPYELYMNYIDIKYRLNPLINTTMTDKIGFSSNDNVFGARTPYIHVDRYIFLFAFSVDYENLPKYIFDEMPSAYWIVSTKPKDEKKSLAEAKKRCRLVEKMEGKNLYLWRCRERR